jgi:UDP-N-acetylglucosamine:LPS N-acetylglucosamine transferase
MKKVMFISSGGGHLNELLRLQPLFSKTIPILVVEKQKFPLQVSEKVVFLPRGTRKKLAQYCFIFMWLCLKSCFLYFKYRPDVIVTTGSHTAVPMCYIASFFKKQIIFIESIARVHSKSLTGKLIEKKCTHILVQWESMLELYPQATYIGQIL